MTMPGSASPNWRVRPAPGQPAKGAGLARLLLQVVECHRVTGEDGFVLKV
jgi:Lrp/AsnC family leucine-responsive transcriptional regulator